MDLSLNLGSAQQQPVEQAKDTTKDGAKLAATQAEETAGTIALYTPASAETAGTVTSAGNSDSSGGASFSAMA